jgi:hypothetical protein
MMMMGQAMDHLVEIKAGRESLLKSLSVCVRL